MCSSSANLDGSNGYVFGSHVILRRWSPVCMCISGMDISQLSRKTLQRVLELLNFQVDVVAGSGFLSFPPPAFDSLSRESWKTL
jgi:hypothetical protein